MSLLLGISWHVRLFKDATNLAKTSKDLKNTAKRNSLLCLRSTNHCRQLTPLRRLGAVKEFIPLLTSDPACPLPAQFLCNKT